MQDVPLDPDFVRLESPCRTEYVVKNGLFLEHCPVFASKKTIYWYRLIHPVEDHVLSGEQQGEDEFHHSICRPVYAFEDTSNDKNRNLCEAIQKRTDQERRLEVRRRSIKIGLSSSI